MASLDAVLGLDQEMTYRLVGNSDFVAAPPTSFNPLIQKGARTTPGSSVGSPSDEIGAKIRPRSMRPTSAVDSGSTELSGYTGSLGLLDE